jgi:hypothetical protein
MEHRVEELKAEGKSTAEIGNRLKEVVKIASFLTPVCKYFCTEAANRIAYDALQVHGGTGYMREFKVERLVRDARITNIYEGTSQLQIVAAIGGAVTDVMADFFAEREAKSYRGGLAGLARAAQGDPRAIPRVCADGQRAARPSFHDVTAKAWSSLLGGAHRVLAARRRGARRPQDLHRQPLHLERRRRGPAERGPGAARGLQRHPARTEDPGVAPAPRAGGPHRPRAGSRGPPSVKVRLATRQERAASRKAKWRSANRWIARISSAPVARSGDEPVADAGIDLAAGLRRGGPPRGAGSMTAVSGPCRSAAASPPAAGREEGVRLRAPRGAPPELMSAHDGAPGAQAEPDAEHPQRLDRNGPLLRGPRRAHEARVARVDPPLRREGDGDVERVLAPRRGGAAVRPPGAGAHAEVGVLGPAEGGGGGLSHHLRVDALRERREVHVEPRDRAPEPVVRRATPRAESPVRRAR